MRALRISSKRALVVVLLIGAGYGFSGLTKLLDLRAFRSILAAHDVLPEFLHWIGALLGPVEVGLSLAWIALIGTKVSVRVQHGIILSSGVVLLAFLFYLLLVPSDRLADVGCGCFGPGAKVVVETMNLPVRVASISLNAVLLALHVWIARAVSRKVD